MTTIGLFRADPTTKTLTEVAETDLATLGLKERYDLQEWIAKQPSVLGEDLLIIAKECNSFDVTAERADLVAIDRAGNLVIIELKRDDSGTDVHWQALKYASYFSRAKPDVLVELLAKHEQVSVDDAVARVLAFVELEDLASVNRDQRIILASHRFAREVTSAVLWLRDRSVDISCVQFTPYADPETGKLYLQSTTIIPVPGTDNYTVTAASPTVAAATASGRGRKEDDVTAFLRRVSVEAVAALPGEIRPDKISRWAGVAGSERYFNIWYKRAPWRAYSLQYKLHLYADQGKQVLSVGLVVTDAAAIDAGFQPQQLASLKQDLVDFGGEAGWAFFDESGSWSWCGANLDGDTLDDELREKATAALKTLVEQFTPKVDELLKAANSQDA